MITESRLLLTQWCSLLSQTDVDVPLDQPRIPDDTVFTQNVASSRDGSKDETFVLLVAILIDQALGDTEVDIRRIVESDLFPVCEVECDNLASFVMLQGQRKWYRELVGSLDDVCLGRKRSIRACKSGVKDGWEGRCQRKIVRITRLAVEADRVLRDLLQVKVFNQAFKHLAEAKVDKVSTSTTTKM